MLEMNAVMKTYGERMVLRGLSLSIRSGEIVALLGPNGAGKTTLVSIACGLVNRDAGEVWINGIDPWQHPRRTAPLVGLAPQDVGVYLRLTVRENLQLFANMYRLPRLAGRRRIDQVAVALGLVNLLNRRADTLSGGERRRLHTALALIHEPQLVLLDEPTTGADVESREALLALVQRLASEGAAVCYSTHYLAEVEALNPVTVAIIQDGTLRTCAPLADLIQSESHTTISFALSTSDAQVRLANALSCSTTCHQVDVASGGVVTVRTRSTSETIAHALDLLAHQLGTISSIGVTPPSLESAYLALTRSSDDSKDQHEGRSS